MTTREELYKKFGPMLIEALMTMMVTECNRLRAQLGMPTITKQIFLDEINDHLSALEPYEWMEE